MQGVRTLPATVEWPRVPWLRGLLFAALLLFFVANVVMGFMNAVVAFAGSFASDWGTYVVASDRVHSGGLYAAAEPWYGWRYSPIAAYLFTPLGWLGVWFWRGLHLLALLALPRWMALVALLSYPFWFDFHAGNVLTFLLVAVYWALRGNRWAIGAVFVAALLMPRPMMLPVVVWLLWKHPEWRWSFAAMFVAHALAVLATGWGDEWVAKLVQVGGDEISANFNVAPSRLVGIWWMALAVPLSVYAFRRGWIATSGLLLQPYWLPYYLLLPLADHPRNATDR